MLEKGISLKKNYSEEFYSNRGKKIFLNIFFVFVLLMFVFFISVSCRNGFCLKKVDSLLKGKVTGMAVGEEFEFNSVERLNKISPSDSVSKGFSESMAVYGEYLVVGDPFDNSLGKNAGAVYIYKKDSSGWTFFQKITGSNSSEGSFFGMSVDISDKYLVVGAPNEKSLKDRRFVPRSGVSSPYSFCGGRVYIFKKGSSGEWEESNALARSSCVNLFSRFGSSVSIFNNKVAIGCPLCRVDYKKEGAALSSYKYSGSVFIYREDSSEWVLEKRMYPEDKEELFFGESVFLGENVLFLSSKKSNSEDVVYFLQRNSSGWGLNGQINLGLGGGAFGSSIFYDGEYLFLGASKEKTGLKDSGSYLDSVNFGPYTSYKEAMEVAYKYNRPLVLVSTMGYSFCSHSRDFGMLVGESAELRDFARENHVVLLLELNTNKLNILARNLSSGKFKMTSLARNFIGVFNVVREPSYLDAFPLFPLILSPVVSSSGEVGVFNYVGSSRKGINGVLVDDYNSWTPSNFIRVLDSFFPNQHWSSFSKEGFIGGGAVYVYKKDASENLNFFQKIVPEGISNIDNFGSSIFVEGNRMSIGSSSFGSRDSREGRVYLYKKDSSEKWVLENELFLFGQEFGNEFGRSLAISNDSVFVGSKGTTRESGKGEIVEYRLFYQEFDTTPPILDLQDYSGYSDLPFSIQMSAIDDKGISHWWINDTSEFSITQQGLVEMKSIPSPGIHSLNIFVNDSSNNIANGVISIEFLDDVCGDGNCRNEENCSNCPEDCEECSVDPTFSFGTSSVFNSHSEEDYSISWENISEGFSCNLIEGQSIRFLYEDVFYRLKLISFSENKSSFELEGGPIKKDIDVVFLESVDVDLNWDGEEDLNIIYSQFIPEKNLLGVQIGESFEQVFEVGIFSESSSNGGGEEKPRADEDPKISLAVGGESTPEISQGGVAEGNSERNDKGENSKNEGPNSKEGSNDLAKINPIWIVGFLVAALFFLAIVYLYFLKNDSSKENLKIPQARVGVARFPQGGDVRRNFPR